MKLIRKLSELNKSDVAIAGGKGASLGEMTQAGFSVPSGFVILSNVFERFVEEQGIGPFISTALDKVKIKDIASIERASEEIQSFILGAKMPEDISVEILNAFKKLGVKSVAVRSSATAEDSSLAAWAGQLDSFLDTTERKLTENVMLCWASLFSPRAIFYRLEKGLKKKKISVAVVIQKMVKSEFSGIAFSVHPVTHDRSQLIIEAARGIGEAIVSGKITPDSYVVKKEPLRIIEKSIQNKRQKAILSEKQITQLSHLILLIENHYGFPCDIEWAFNKGKFYILQSRPITTLGAFKKNADVSIKEKFITYENPIYPYFYSPTMHAAIPTYKGRSLMGEWYAKFRYKNTSIIKAPEKSFDEDGEFYLGLILRKDKALSAHLFALGKKIVALGKDLEIRNYNDLRSGKVSKASEFYNEYKNIFGEVLGFGYSLDYALDKYIKVNDIDLHSIKGGYPSFIQLEKQELKKIFKGKKGLALDKALGEHALRYSWLQNDYSGEYQISVAEILKQRSAILKELLSIKPKKITKPNNIKEWISFLTFIRDERKKCNLIGTGLLDRYLKQECLRLDIDYGRAVMLTVDEFEASKKRSIKNYNGIRTVHISKNGVTDMPIRKWDNVTAEEDIADKDEFTGTSAMSGVVTGVAKIIMQRLDFPKLKQGEIIVTSMTRPEFAPIMGKCSAIITNEGGVTSHAAIIARELRKPCVIGTGVATKLIYDGDTVRVDGNKGTITIIKRHK